MKERTFLILKIIVAAVGVVAVVLIWMDKIPTPFEGKPVPMTIVGTITALVYFCIDLFKKKEKEEKSISVQQGKESISVIGEVKDSHIGHTTYIQNHDPKK